MNYGELREFFHALLNRNDCDDSLADKFISLGLRRTERLLRTPLQSNKLKHTVAEDTWTGRLRLPTDYLGMIELAVNDIPYRRITKSQREDLAGYFISFNDIHIVPEVEEGDVISLEYHAEFEETSSGNSEPPYSQVIPDLVIYAALVYAGDYFIDERTSSWKNSYSELTKEVQLMSDISSTEGGLSIRPQGGGIV